MDIKELKQQLLDKKYNSEFMIFKYSDNKYLVEQYVQRISEFTHKQINKITSLSDILSTTALSLVVDFSNTINVLDVDEFNEALEDYSDLQNCIVICNTIAKGLNNVNQYVIDFPKLEDWQILDYIKTRCSALTEDQSTWLFEATSKNIYRISNELDKVCLFDSNHQNVLAELKNDSVSDLYITDVFKLTDAIINNKRTELIEYLAHNYACNIDAFGLIGSLIKTLKNVLFVKYNKALNFTQIGISQKQYFFMCNHYEMCSEKYLKNALQFLTSLDSKLKTGKLDFNDNQNELISYIICNILNCY